MDRPRVLVVLPLIAAALLAAGCGGDDNGSTTATEDTTATGEATTLQLAADPSGALAFDKTSLEAPAGTVTVELTNDSSVPHNVEVEGNGVEEESDTITGSTTSVTVDLEPGTYEFYCAVPGHKEAGMEGTLTVS
jgi:plastocyanin